MAHDIWHDELSNVDSVFVAKKPAWHGLGQVTGDTLTWKEAIKRANLDWTVSKLPLFSQAGKQVDAFGIFRDRDNQFLGVAGDRYEIIQNERAFTFIDAILEQTDGAHYESAGALGHGERIWALARVPEADIQIAGTDDRSLTYLLVATSHDSSIGFQSRLTSTRVVCANTLNVALNEAGRSIFRVKHTRMAEVRLQAAEEAARGIVMDARALEEKLNFLATRKLTRESLSAILDRLFPKNDDPKAKQGRREANLTEVLKLYESNDNNAFPVLRGTAYNLLNAVTEFSDHYRNVKLSADRKDQKQTVDSARAEAAIFGAGDKLKVSALETILEVADDLQPVRVAA